MKVLILEDELPAYNKIYGLINKLIKDVHILGWARTVAEAKILLENNTPDLIFSDIELLDGLSFNLFEEVDIACPIIFCTAYDQYLFKAFQTNGIAYLLKPYDEEAFIKVYEKYRQLIGENRKSTIEKESFSEIKEALRVSQNAYKKRFSVKKNNGIKLVKVEDVVMFEAQGDFSFLHDNTAEKNIINYSLGSIESKIDPQKFFRINRSEIISINYITKMEPYSKNRLHITLSNGYKTLSSESRTPDFRKWFED